MKNFLRPHGLWWLCLLLWLPSAHAQMIASRVSKILIRHIGPPAVSDDFIRANIRVRVGEPLYRATVDEDIGNLYATGYFYKIQVTQDTDPDGGVDVTYIVQGNPVLTDIKIIGNKKMSLKKLRKKLTSKIGQPLDQHKLFEDSMAMQDLYEKAGYQKTRVIVQPPSIDELAGRASVVIEIQEAPKVKIKDIVFVNAHAFTQRQLRKVLKTRRRWWMSWLTGSGVLKEDDFEDDKDALVEHYQNAGYIDFAIQDVKFDDLKPGWMTIRIIETEGQPYKVGTLDITGNAVFTTNDFLHGRTIDHQLMKLQLTPGKVFTPVGFSADTDTLRDFYGSRGYLDPQQGGGTEIAATRTANPTTGTIDLSYAITEGEPCYIEKIEIKGNVKTKDKVLRRELAVSPGEVYDMVRVKISKERLDNLDYFSKVDTQAEDTDVPNRKNLVVGVEEKGTGAVTVGAGFSSVESLVGFIELKQGNFDLFNPPTFTGAGQKFQVQASVGNELQDYEINFIEPWLFGKQLSLGVDLFHRYDYYDSLNNFYAETFDGGTLSLTKALWTPKLRGTVSYTGEAAHLSINSGFTTNSTTNYVSNPGALFNSPSVTPPNISTNIYDEHGTHFISKVGLTLSYDTRDNYRQPDRGQLTELITEFATPPGDVTFYKIDLHSDWFFPGFLPGHILELGAKAGVVDPVGGTTDIPIYERWFLGGLYSLRGFRYRDVGPQDNFGEPLGGDTYVFGTAEYSIPIVPKYVRLAAFYDIGNVFTDPYSLNAGPGRVAYSDNYGLGLRILLPVQGGIPLRLDYGIPIRHDPNVSASGHIQIGFGYQRSF